MAFASEAGLQAAQAFLAGAPDLISKLQAAGLADEAALVEGMHGAASDLITQIEGTENRVIDHGISELGKLLNSQRISLVSDVDRRFVALGAVIEALGQAMQKTTVS